MRRVRKTKERSLVRERGSKKGASGFMKEALGDLSGIEEATVFVNFLISGIKYLRCSSLKVITGGVLFLFS